MAVAKKTKSDLVRQRKSIAHHVLGDGSEAELDG